jgi:hypothetical protein
VISDWFHELQRRADALLRATSPIYAQAEKHVFEAVGTGIFFTHRDRHFVLSAAHVLRRMNEERLLIGDNRLVTLNGRFFRAPSDDVDLAFVPLNDEQYAHVAGALFLSAVNVHVSDRPEMAPDGRRFYVVGFRADMNAPEAVHTTVVAAGAAYLAHAAPETTYRDLGASAERHLVLTFNRNVLYSGATTIEPEEEPQGMSGSGVWQFKPPGESEKLVAILTEHSNKHKAIIAARIGPLLDSVEAYANDGLV